MIELVALYDGFFLPSAQFRFLFIKANIQLLICLILQSNY